MYWTTIGAAGVGGASWEPAQGIAPGGIPSSVLPSDLGLPVWQTEGELVASPDSEEPALPQ